VQDKKDAAIRAADTRTERAEARAREEIEQAHAEARSLVQAAEDARDRAGRGGRAEARGSTGGRTARRYR